MPVAPGGWGDAVATVAWPTGEFGGMGLAGAVKLALARELAAIDDPGRRRAALEEMVRQAYEHGKALNAASMFEIDDVIDPVVTRRWITATLGEVSRGEPAGDKRRPHIDTW